MRVHPQSLVTISEIATESSRCRARRVVPRARQENDGCNSSLVRRGDRRRTDQGEREGTMHCGAP